MKRVLLLIGLLAGAAHVAWAGDPLEKLAKQFGRTLSSLKKPTVGILTFPYHDGKISSGSTILSERLTTYMADDKNIRIIERTLLSKVLEEQHLSETGVTDASAAQQIGKVLNVDVLVVGTLNDLEDNETELNARLLRSDTGEVLAARELIVDRVWTDSPHHPRPPTVAVLNADTDDDTPSPGNPNEAIEVGYPSGSGNSGVGTRRVFRSYGSSSGRSR